MSRVAGLWLVAVPAALVGGALAAWITVTSNHLDHARLTAVLTLLGSWSFIASMRARLRRSLA